MSLTPGEGMKEGGGEGGCLLRTEAIEGARDGNRKVVRSHWAAIFSCDCSSLYAWCDRARAATRAWSMGSMGSGVEGREAQGSPEEDPPSCGSSEEGLGKCWVWAEGFLLPSRGGGSPSPQRASGSWVLPPTAMLGLGASTAMSADWSPLPLCLRVLFRGFAALQALKKLVQGADLLRTSRTNMNITSLILVIGRVFEGETSFRALRTRCVCPWGMNSTQVIGEVGVLHCANVTKETSQPLSRCQQE